MASVFPASGQGSLSTVDKLSCFGVPATLHGAGTSADLSFLYDHFAAIAMSCAEYAMEGSVSATAGLRNSTFGEAVGQSSVGIASQVPPEVVAARRAAPAPPQVVAKPQGAAPRQVVAKPQAGADRRSFVWEKDITPWERMYHRLILPAHFVDDAFPQRLKGKILRTTSGSLFPVELHSCARKPRL
ncbi:hypothetical protein PIB30_085394 [Stylosanthes scabra]|uniref:Uncharacterized protein n=1 Tax=Stylosanthes scabra TaxID=79078 RepID=A0ABU6XV63_9FABA|nr:hypothetical protein [Stylosanthes scabra]